MTSPEIKEIPREYTVRNATASDAASIARIQHESWLATYPNESVGITREDILAHRASKGGVAGGTEIWTRFLEKNDPAFRVWVIEDQGKVVGFCKVKKEERRTHIDALYLDPQRIATGAGAKVFQDALAWLGEDLPAELEVASHNARAIAFYQRFGFVEEGPAEPFLLQEGKVMPLTLMRRPENIVA